MHRSGPSSPGGPDRRVAATFHSRVAAELARSMLVNEGIEATLSADDAGGLHPELPLVTGGVRLSVRADELDVARALLDGHA